MVSRSEPGKDGHAGGVGTYGGGVDPRLGLFHGVVVDEVAGFKIVGAVKEEVGGAKKGVNVGGNEISDHSLNFDGRVEGCYFTACGLCLGQGGKGVGFVEEDLALKVGELDEVTINEDEVANAGAGQQGCGGRSSGSYADNGHVSLAEEVLTGGGNPGKEDLAGVAVGERVGGYHALVIGRGDVCS